MSKNLNNILKIIIPQKKISTFTIFILILGIISGSIFIVIINKTDKDFVIKQITNFINNINTNNINNFNAFKNALIQNTIIIFLIWILGMSIIGIIINIFLVYFKGFISGFTISSFFLVYKYKGLLLGVIYIVPTIIINLLLILLVGAYSIEFTIYLWKIIFLKNKTINTTKILKKYFIILLISIIVTIITSLTEGYLVPSLIKLCIKIFI